jgi:fructokinase
MPEFYGGIEAGGTKFVCGVGTIEKGLLEEQRFATTSPKETIGRVNQYFEKHSSKYKISALGVGSFGPVDLHKNSTTFGFITSTPKSGWSDTNIVGELEKLLKVPVFFDTDVNAAALGEHVNGAASGIENFIYLTVGTGIGGGGMINGKLLHGQSHPEMGHIRIPHNITIDPFKGNCPYHGDCLEGLASGEAINKRWGTRAEILPDQHPAWNLESEYLALALVNYICTLSPEKIIIGGGIMQRTHLFNSIRTKVKKLMNNYALPSQILDNLNDYIVPPALGKQAGVFGAIAMAELGFEQ